jgi:molecular chaperone GrpE
MNSDSDPGKNDGGNGAVDAGKTPEAKPASKPEEAAAAAPTELEAVRAERDKLRDQLLRVAADFDNFRKRSKRDVDDARTRGKDDLIRDLLPVFDNLERATHTGSASDVASVLEGVRMVLKLFEDTAERVGLKRVPALGQRFDPAVHDAIQQKETNEHPPGTVIAEIAPGYRFGERLVRPAVVVVARKAPEAAATAEPRVSARPPSASAPSSGAPASNASTETKTDDGATGPSTDKGE